jgi:indolepyruvate ferredoxin oxidoreductase
LRGSELDPFGRTEERRTERALIDGYPPSRRFALLRIVSHRIASHRIASLPQLDAGRLTLAAEIASVPERMHGLVHVKARHLADARAAWQALDEGWVRRGVTSSIGGVLQRKVA